MPSALSGPANPPPRFRRRSNLEWFCALTLLISALTLFLTSLNLVALRDWDEGIVAQVAREIWQNPQSWLHPTLHGQPYLNKPPLVHSLIALSYQIFGSANEVSARVPGAILSSISVPLLYFLGRELWPHRAPAVWAALAYLTWLPVGRHGRLAMLEGALLCFWLLWLLCLLRTRRNLSYALGLGIAATLVGLTKGVMVVVLFGALSLGFLLWDTPRLLTTPWFWWGISLGLLPLGAWYLAQWNYYGQDFLVENLLNQSASRVWDSVDGNTGPPWYYLLELLKYGFPNLVFLPAGLKLAWQNQTLSWARLILVCGGGYLGAISLMGTKLPWYILPLYPMLSLAVGVVFAEIWDYLERRGQPSHDPHPRYPKAWFWCFLVMALAAWTATLLVSYSLTEIMEREMLHLLPPSLLAALTLSLCTILIARRSANLPSVFIWGWFITLMFFFGSFDWVWELNEDYPVKPVAAMIEQETQGQPVYTSHPYNRPSLNFYANRPVITASPEELQEYWHRETPTCVLVDDETLEQLDVRGEELAAIGIHWILACHTGRGTIAAPTLPVPGETPPS